MRRILAAAAALMILGTLAPAALAATAQDLWPNQVGNTWTYEVSGRIGGGTTAEAKVLQASGGWVQVEGFLGTRWWYMSRQSGRVWAWDETSGTYTQVFHLGLAKGSTFKASLPGASCFDGTTWVIQESASTVDTAVGTFQNCVIIASTRSVCADAGIGEIVFAPGVGIVRWSEQSIAGPRTSNLAGAEVNGTRYSKKSSKGLTVCVSIEKYTHDLIVNRMPTPVPPQNTSRPDTLVARFELKNETQETIEFRYASGQSYDFVIYNESGRDLYRWSENQFFTQATRTERLAPGQSVVYSKSIELRDRSGVVIPAGKYRVEALHKGSPSSATVPFKIDVHFVY